MGKVHCLSFFLRHQFRGTILQYLLRFTWELPQTLFGASYTLLILLFCKIYEMQIYDGVMVIRCRIGHDYWGGICFGSIILGDSRIKAEINNALFMHEFGHVLQSRQVGPIYLFKYGIPSLLSAYGEGRHNHHPVERDANQRACDWFSQKEGFHSWENDFNPLPESGRKNSSSELKFVVYNDDIK